MADSMTYFYEGDQGIRAVLDAAARGWMLRVDDVKAAKVVFTYFASEQDLEDAYFDSEGLVQLLKAGSYLVDFSPASPTFTHELYSVASVSDLHYVAAPLAIVDPVAVHPFAPENVVVYAGGDDADIQALQPILAQLGTVKPAGDAAAAQLARAGHTVNLTAKLLAAVETEALFRAVRASSLGVDSDMSKALDTLADDEFRAAIHAVTVGDDEPGDVYTIGMLRGELQAALAAADDVELVLPQLEAVMSLVELMSVIGGEDRAPAALSLLFLEEDEGRKYGLDWGRARELFAHPDDEDEDDEDADDDEYDHHHTHVVHYGYEQFYEHQHDHGHAQDHEYEDEPYGFDRFADDDDYDDDEDDDADDEDARR